MTTLYANPYDTNYFGFYFDTIEKFNKYLSKAKYEEVEIEFIDGDNPQLFAASNIHQGNVDYWFNELDQYSDTDDENLAIIYLMEFMGLDDAIHRHEEVNLFRGSIADYAAELIEELYPVEELPEIIKYHIDYSAIAKDMALNSEVTEISNNIWVVNCLEF
jgi:hypothetical protein